MWVALTKAAVRAQIRERVAALTDRAPRDAAIVARLASLLPPGPVLAYAAMADEVSLDPLLQRLASEGRLVLPRVRDGELEVVAVPRLEALVPGTLRIREPVGEPLSPTELAAVLVPGRAFDAAGGRVGRSGGYYDRLLPHAPQALRIAVAWEAQVLPEVPMEAHDVRVDAIVSEARTRWTGARAAGPLAALHPELVALVARIGATPGLPVVVLDVDSTLFSTAERHRRILVEFAQQRGDPALLALALGLAPSDFGWSVEGPVRAAGLTDEGLLGALRAFWAKRFFADGWCDLDLPMPGAVQAVRAFAEAGALVVYLTGRMADRMEAGTLRLLRRWGLPLHDGRSMLVMKPDASTPDATFKAEAMVQLARLGTVVATFENEPGHANHFVALFPEAVHLLLDTVHTPDAPAPLPEVRVLPGWLSPR